MVLHLPLLLLAFIFITGCLVYFIIDFKGPSVIRLKPKNVFGFSCLRARDLVVQEYDKHGNLWATRGMIAYKLVEDEDVFKKVTHIPTGFSIFWLRNFTLVRRLTIRPEHWYAG
jgi:hypothetical protein